MKRKKLMQLLIIDYKKIINPTVTRKDIQPMNSQNAHVLVGDKNKQVAVDINPPSQSNRGCKRAVFDYEHNNNNNKPARYKFAGYTDNHDYKSIPKFGESNFDQIHSNCSDNLKMTRQVNNLTCNQVINEEAKRRINTSYLFFLSLVLFDIVVRSNC